MSLQQADGPLDLFEPLDRVGPLPLWAQIADRLERAISVGDVPLHGRLESEVVLADRLRVSRQTVQRAQQELVARGLVVRRRGLGTQIMSGQRAPRPALTGLWDELLASGRQPSTVVVSCRPVAAGRELAERMDVAQGTVVTRLERVRRCDGKAIAVLLNWLPQTFEPPSAEQLTVQGLYPLLRGQGITLRSAEQSITGRSASAREARLLETSTPSPVIELTRLVRDAGGAVVEFGRHLSLAGARVMTMTLIAP